MRPYQRPPLSKQAWISPDQELVYSKEIRAVSLDSLDGVESGVGWLKATVGRVDTEEKFVVLQNGARVFYDKLLLATGVSPKL